MADKVDPKCAKFIKQLVDKKSIERVIGMGVNAISSGTTPEFYIPNHRSQIDTMANSELFWTTF